jgi:hybrid cluster-associated redox disulfide protein
MMLIDPKATVSDVLNLHPTTMRVFIDHGMACIGCVIAPYHTIAEACAEYNLAAEKFVREMTDALNGSSSS